MNLLSPWGLLALLPVAALAVGYLIAQRRRQRYAVRFASLPMLDRVVPRRPRWRRHLVAAFVLTALAALGLALARPELQLRVPYDRATVMLAIDTSGSMAATDVTPNRLEAAKAAAVAFVGELPETVNVGVVSFAGSAAVVAPPTTDHEVVQRQIAGLNRAGGGTAIGEGVIMSVEQVVRMAEDAADPNVPARIVLLSDGGNTAGRTPEQAARIAVDAAVPVSTIAYGTSDGSISGGRSPVPVDAESLQALADATGGRAYSAETGEQLRDIYADIGSSIGWRTEPREVTPYLAGLALLLTAGAGALSLRWFARLL